MSMDDMKDTREKLVEAAEKLSAYVEGMDKLTEYVGELWKEIEAANSTLGSAAKEKQLKNTADALEKMNEELKALKAALANFSDRGSLVRQRIEKATMMTAEIRDIDARVARLCKSFNRLNRNKIADLVVAVGRFEVTSKELKSGLKNLSRNVCDRGEYLNRINKKLSMIEMLKSENDALDRRINTKLWNLGPKEYVSLKERIQKIKEDKETNHITKGKEQDTESIAQNKEKILNKIAVGDEVILGQRAGKNMIWKVIDKDNDKILLISKYGIVKKAFNHTEMAIWENSTLRKYLNERFINKYFESQEAEMIVEENFNISSCTKERTMSKASNSDRIFLLNQNQIGYYFRREKDLICYGLNGGNIVSSSPCEWWIIDVGQDITMASTVNARGRVNTSGRPVSDKTVYIRPAMWIQPTGKCNIYKVGEKTDELLPDEIPTHENVNGGWKVADLLLDSPIEEGNDIDLEDNVSIDQNDGNLEADIIAEDNMEAIDEQQFKKEYKPALLRSRWYYDVEVSKASITLKKGDIVAFGSWFGQSILWRVLGRRKGHLMLISLFGICPILYGETRTMPSWKESLVRDYLNNEFYTRAFLHSEQNMIEAKTVNYYEPADVKERKLHRCIDRIFIPSRKEIEALKEEPVNLKCMAIRGKNGDCAWWLRATGNEGEWLSYVDTDGNVVSGDYKSSSKLNIYVRPVVWIDVTDDNKYTS